MYVLVAACNYAGQRYEDGEEMLPYPNEPCFVCNCRDGNMECMTTSCPPLECDEGTAVAEIGKCCPVCPGNAGALYRLPPSCNKLISYKSYVCVFYVFSWSARSRSLELDSGKCDVIIFPHHFV